MNYGASRIELESCHFGGYGHAHHHVKDGLELGELGRYLLGLCFCGSCATAARELGLDPVHLRDQATALLDPAFADGRPLAEEPGSFLERRPEFAALQVMREDAVASLVDEVRKRCRTAVSFIHMGDRWSTGVVPERILQSADLLEVLAYTGSAGQVGAQVQAALTAALTPDRLLVGLQAYHPCATSAELLAAQVNAAARLGVRHFSYYNYGIMPRANLAWIRSCTSGRQDTARAG
jgi:hypothetical protein